MYQRETEKDRKANIKGENSEIHGPTPIREHASNTGLDEERSPGMTKENTAWDVCNNEARKVDNELVKDWTASLNFLLVFAAIFSAVLAAFIIETKKLLEPDPGEEMVEVMVFYTNTLATGTPTAYNRIPFKPSTTAVSINCLLFGSLGASLAAALASVVALQWVAEFDAAITRGGSSPQDRAERRQFRFAGVQKWKMGGIIAILPLLLYFSVVLFFVGVIQWMFFLHPTVGYVVAGGAAIAAIFYCSSTLMGVAFVSAPFKSPLSRFIYTTFHLPFLIGHWIMTAIKSKDIPKWVDERRQRYLNAYKREDKAVESRADLKYQAMHWLVEQLSVSEDTRHRFFLLAAELRTWPAEQLQSPEFMDGPWMKVLNFLSRAHRRNLHSTAQGDEYGQELAILTLCAESPVIASIIAPNDSHHYELDPSEYAYWTQYCVTNSGAESALPFTTTPMAIPDELLLITRDLPVPSLHTREEVECTQRLAKWRNSAEKDFAIWRTVFESSNLSDKFFNASICTLSGYIVALGAAVGAGAHIRGLENWTTLLAAPILNRGIESGISPDALCMFLRAWQSMVTKKKLRSTSTATSRIDRPLVYGTLLGEWAPEEHDYHLVMTVLVTRDFNTRDWMIESQQLYDILGMIWLYCPRVSKNHYIWDDWLKSTGHIRDWETLTAKYGDECTLADLKDEILHDWIFMVDNVIQFREVLQRLVLMSYAKPAFSTNWLTPCVKKGGAHLFALLRVFDQYICQEQKYTTPSNFLRVLCTILRTDGLHIPEHDTSIDYGDMIIRELKTPEFRTIAVRALRTKSLPEPILNQDLYWSDPMNQAIAYIFWNMSMSDPAPVWELRASLMFKDWGPVSDLIIPILAAAFSKPTQLLLLDRIFAHRTRCEHHPNLGPGHLIHHLQEAIDPRIAFRSDITLFDSISLKDLPVSPITALLATPKFEDISLLKLPQDVNKDCIVQLWKYLDNIRSNQFMMISLLVGLESYHTPPAIWGSFAVLLKAIEDTIALPMEEASIALLIPLCKRIEYYTTCYYRFLTLNSIQPEAQLSALLFHGQRVRNVIITKLAMRKVYGRLNSQLVCCARASSGTQFAGSHFPVYI